MMGIMTIVFADCGLHLGVLNALLDRGVIPAAELTAIVDSAGLAVPDSDSGWDRLEAALPLLHAFPASSTEAAAIDRLDFDGGNDIYMWIERALGIDTGGESGYYRVESLEGIHALSGLRSLDLDGYGYRPAALDLTPLTDHPALSSLFLSGECTVAGALESLPSLRDLSVWLADLDDPDVLTRLEVRGVTVRRHWR